MENLDFDTAINNLETILDRLENDENLNAEEAQKLYEEAENLKNHCKSLLEKEKLEIIKIAKENDIPLSELDFDDSDLDEDDEEEDEDEDDEEFEDDEGEEENEDIENK